MATLVQAPSGSTHQPVPEPARQGTRRVHQPSHCGCVAQQLALHAAQHERERGANRQASRLAAACRLVAERTKQQRRLGMSVSKGLAGHQAPGKVVAPARQLRCCRRRAGGGQGRQRRAPDRRRRRHGVATCSWGAQRRLASFETLQSCVSLRLGRVLLAACRRFVQRREQRGHGAALAPGHPRGCQFRQGRHGEAGPERAQHSLSWGQPAGSPPSELVRRRTSDQSSS